MCSHRLKSICLITVSMLFSSDPWVTAELLLPTQQQEMFRRVRINTGRSMKWGHIVLELHITKLQAMAGILVGLRAFLCGGFLGFPPSVHIHSYLIRLTGDSELPLCVPWRSSRPPQSHKAAKIIDGWMKQDLLVYLFIFELHAVIYFCLFYIISQPQLSYCSACAYAHISLS